MDSEKTKGDRMDGRLSNNGNVSARMGLSEVGTTRTKPRPPPLNLRRTPTFSEEVAYMNDRPVAMAENTQEGSDDAIERGMGRLALGARENRSSLGLNKTTTLPPSFKENDNVMNPDENRPYATRVGPLLKTRSMTSAELKEVSVIPTEQIYAMAEELKASEPPLTLDEARERRATLKKEEEVKEVELKKEKLEIRRKAVSFLRTRAKERAAAQGVELHLPPSPGSRKVNFDDKAQPNA